MTTEEKINAKLQATAKALLAMKRPTTTTHTPGPWSLGPRTATYGKVYSEATERPCIAHIMQIVDDLGKPDAESLANARLIAAAPALYAALKETLDALYNETVGGNNGDSPWITSVKDRANDALAQADGKEQP